MLGRISHVSADDSSSQVCCIYLHILLSQYHIYKNLIKIEKLSSRVMVLVIELCSIFLLQL